MRILFINNKDSFVYNLVDYTLRVSEAEVIVMDNTINLEEIEEIKPDRIIISPGPGHPRDAGNIIPIIRHFYKKTTILGVCLGHQAIYEAFGGEVDKADVGPIHGKLSWIYHDGRRIYKGLPNPFEAARYHSLEVKAHSIPGGLKVVARASDGTVMGIRHRWAPLEGVQFHPESIITNEGLKIIDNFIREKA